MEQTKKEKGAINSTQLPLDSVKNQVQGTNLSNVIDREFGKKDTFPFDIFPIQIQELIKDAENTIGFNPEYLSTGILSVCATAIGTSIDLDNGSYKTMPILWLAIIGRSGTGKTHPLSFAINPLKEKDKQYFIEYQELYKIYELQDNKGSKPKYINSILSDFTIEKLAETLQYNDKGVIIFKDELIGWINSFDQYNSGGEQQKYIELFNGQTLTKDRVSNKAIRVEKPNVNILGGLQPKVLKKMASNNRNEDGFLARFLFVYPTNLKPNLFTGKNITEENSENYKRFILNLYDAPKMTLKTSESQKKIFQKWQHKKVVRYFNDEIENIVQSKLQTYVWRLALIIEVMQQASTNNFNEHLSNDSIEKAIILVEYFRLNTLKVYDKILSNNPLDDLSTNKIDLYNKLPTTFKRIDVLPLFEEFKVKGGSVNRFLSNKLLFIRTDNNGNYKKK